VGSVGKVRGCSAYPTLRPSALRAVGAPPEHGEERANQFVSTTRCLASDPHPAETRPPSRAWLWWVIAERSMRSATECPCRGQWPWATFEIPLLKERPMATTSSLLRDHVTLSVRSVDRVFLHAYVPGLMTKYQVIRFLLHRGYPIPSPAALGKIGKGFVKDIERFVADNGIPLV